MNPANALTLLSAASAMVGLLTLVTLRGPLAGAVAVTAVGASLLLDRFDGMVARRLGLVSAMGAQLDSLADLLAFGALPAALVVTVHRDAPTAVGALLYALGAVWRLARYDGDELVAGRFGETFRGVPTPAAGSAMVTAVTASQVFALPAWVGAATALALAALMPSSLRYPKRGVGAWPWMVAVPLAVAAQWWRVRSGG